MAIAPTGNIFKALSFDNVSSRTYGVYITGEAVYNAPGRDVEMVEIPGRNGSFALDKGRFQNIEVSYPAGIFADSEADFAEAVSDFRNFLCSRNGYVRLTDEYNPNEYRMAIYKSGLEVSPAQLKAGEFTITFDCKPQRWLTSGETVATVANNGTLTNPTLFDSSPLLAVEGYGTIGFNGYEIEITSGDIGTITICENKFVSDGSISIPISQYAGMYDNNDSITISLYSVGVHIYDKSSTATWFFSTNATSTFTTEAGQGTPSALPTVTGYARDAVDWGFSASLPNIVFSASANFGRKTLGKILGTIPLEDRSCNTATMTLETVIEIEYVNNDSITLYLTPTMTSSVDISNFKITGTSGDGGGKSISIRNAQIESTVTRLGHPTYIDCDFGEAYMIKNGSVISLNQYIDLGSDLPKLASGTTTFTKSNTVTQLKVTPRWWKV